ncbi:MAG: hypothetical protein LBN36_08990 [Clostridiales Family XIII bacterium]|jgi:molybdopterin-guanine dinucleotide biosynthesis protein B|nr:hypothetical protein [Clostridiales Family XIII bacterium]
MVDTSIGSACNSGNRTPKGEARLVIDGIEIEMVPFVRNILRNAVTGVVCELEGYREDSRIEVFIE